MKKIALLLSILVLFPLFSSCKPADPKQETYDAGNLAWSILTNYSKGEISITEAQNKLQSVISTLKIIYSKGDDAANAYLISADLAVLSEDLKVIQQDKPCDNFTTDMSKFSDDMRAVSEGFENRLHPVLSETPAVAQSPAPTPTPAATDTPIHTPTVEPSTEPTDSLEPTQAGEAKVTQKVLYTWEDSSHHVHAYTACEITNVGKSPISVDSATFSLLDKQGGVIDTHDATYIMPGIIGPGETAYSYEEFLLENISDPADIASVDIAGSFEPTDDKPVLLKVTGTKYYPPQNQWVYHKVTGWVENDNAETAENPLVGCVLFDKDNKLLGVLIDNQVSALKPNSKAAFSACYPEIPHTITDKIATEKVVAFDLEY